MVHCIVETGRSFIDHTSSFSYSLGYKVKLIVPGLIRSFKVYMVDGLNNPKALIFCVINDGILVHIVKETNEGKREK